MMLIPDPQAERAIHVIDTSGIADTLEELLALAPQGRPRRLTLRAWLIGAYLAIEERGSFKNTAIHEVLTIGLSQTKQRELGVRYTTAKGTEKVIGKSSLDYVTRWLPKRLAYTESSAKLWGLDLDETKMDRRRKGLQAALAALLDASLVTTGGSWYALDGSGVWSWGKSKSAVDDPDDVRAQEDVAEDAIEDRTPMSSSTLQPSHRRATTMNRRSRGAKRSPTSTPTRPSGPRPTSSASASPTTAT